MINFATVHWRDPSWIPVQRRFLTRNVAGPWRLWAFADRIGKADPSWFHYRSDLPVERHEWKLNLLGDLICGSGAADDELIVFIDGDAFPVAPLDEALRSRLQATPLIAVRRDESAGDPQPHPCFCATTVGLWRRIGGDWRPGATWTDPGGRETTDVGGELMAILEREGVEWSPLLRSNIRDLHPLMFGVYDDLVYHHGGGFRRTAGGRAWSSNAQDGFDRDWRVRLLDRIPGGRSATVRNRFHPRRRARRAAIAQIQETGAQVRDLIESDDEFWRLFCDPAYEGKLASARVASSPAELRLGRG